MKRHADAELWSELSLGSGVDVQDVSEKDSPTRVQFQVPKLLITTSLKKNANSAELSPVVVFEIDLKQNAFADLVKQDSQTRTIRFGWDGDPQIALKCRFADGYQVENPKIDNDLINARLLECWKAWTSLAPVTSATVPDLDFGISRLRLSSTGWASPHLFATFTPPGVKITNVTEVDFIYQTKGPYSDWSNAKYKIEPGKSHDFDISYPLTYRRNGEVYTLAPGSHSEFRVPITGGPPRLFQARETPSPDAGKPCPSRQHEFGSVKSHPYPTNPRARPITDTTSIPRSHAAWQTILAEVLCFGVPRITRSVRSQRTHAVHLTVMRLPTSRV